MSRYPFNPETWIPYHLATDAEVQLAIYDTRGALVRQLALGYQPAGRYESRSCAAYWQGMTPLQSRGHIPLGRNAVGERVASGIYFYTFTAGDVAAARKMLGLK